MGIRRWCSIRSGEQGSEDKGLGTKDLGEGGVQFCSFTVLQALYGVGGPVFKIIIMRLLRGVLVFTAVQALYRVEFWFVILLQ